MMTLTLMPLLAAVHVAAAAHYDPNWPSLMTRPLPPWFDEAKVGEGGVQLSVRPTPLELPRQIK